MNQRLRRLNVFVLAIVVAYTIVLLKYIAANVLIGPVIDPIVVFLSSIGFYKLLIELLFQLVEKVPLFLTMYWGRLYLDGLWSYTYTLEGCNGTDTSVYFGVWRFEQTLYDTHVVGFGLTDNFIVRSRVRSMTDMISNAGMHEFINIRSDSVASASDNYSRTSMYFELNKRKLLRYPIRIRGITVVYGGPLNGRICNNVFIKHESARTEEDVIADLKRSFVRAGKVEADAKLEVHTSGNLLVPGASAAGDVPRLSAKSAPAHQA